MQMNSDEIVVLDAGFVDGAQMTCCGISYGFLF
jgi:hypothetical protein